MTSSEPPVLDRLTHRLTECPAEFLAEPRIAGSGRIHVDAVVSDLLVDLGGQPLTVDEARTFQSASSKDRNLLRLVLVATWLMHDDFFCEARNVAAAVQDWLRGGLAELAALVSADQFVGDPDRREELVRLGLAALGLRPAGETPEQAADRLKTLSSVERAALIRETKAQIERARVLRRKMEEEAAREAAARVTRE
ncbi:MAG: hypothetical protein HYX75_12940 [Acidobacteria bacterium]|nr:hypothetical protein [Acidobacteriota bacterium]